MDFLSSLKFFFDIDESSRCFVSKIASKQAAVLLQNYLPVIKITDIIVCRTFPLRVPWKLERDKVYSTVARVERPITKSITYRIQTITSLSSCVHGYIRNRAHCNNTPLNIHTIDVSSLVWNPSSDPRLHNSLESRCSNKPITATYINSVLTGPFHGADVQNKWRGGGERSSKRRAAATTDDDSPRQYSIPLRRSRAIGLGSRGGEGDQVCAQRQMAAISFSVACVAINCSW